MFVKKIGVDLGTCNSLVFVPKKGIILNEPSVVAVSLAENKILAVGYQAKEMIGKTPDTIRVYRPLKDGVIADFRVTQAMLKYFISKALGRFHLFKPDIMVSVPAGASSTEKRAVIEAAINAGAREAFVAKEPVLAAIGANIPINSPSGHMVVDIGGGTTETAIISLGGIVVSESLRVAGDKLNSAIIDYIKKKYSLVIGPQTAERAKIEIGTAVPEKKERFMEIKGTDLILGLPKTIKISSNEVYEAIINRLDEISQSVKNVLRMTPPELAADVIDQGITISGGGALLGNIDKFMSKSTGVPCYIAKEPLLCVAKGAGFVLESLDTYKRSIMTKK